MPAQNRHLILWLSGVCAVIYMMIVVGGITRLTQSGLSMVDWRPIMGIVPPLNTAEWQAAFDAYRQYPEYQKINKGMSLDAFKSIFYWEYGHRVLGRIIGLVYFVPFLVFLVLGKVESQWRPRLWIAFVLGGLQGLMGWYMVKSGLVDVPAVSHYRLAAHLMLAIVILAFLFWLILDMLEVKAVQVSGYLRQGALLLAALLFVQLVLGAFVAGLDAGYGFNTYPLMHGQFLADAAVMMEPFWHNLIENGVMIQFLHRWVGALLLLAIVAYVLLAMRTPLKSAALVLLVISGIQFLLGITTLVMRVPVSLGSLHQAVACLMVLSMVYVIYLTRTRSRVL